jgi:hypothetical protein
MKINTTQTMEIKYLGHTSDFSLYHSSNICRMARCNATALLCLEVQTVLQLQSEQKSLYFVMSKMPHIKNYLYFFSNLNNNIQCIC